MIANVEIVFHLAATPGLAQSWTDFESYWTCNVLGTQRLLEALRQANRSLRRFVYASTSSVYGAFASGDETLPTKPVSPYGVTKLAGENLCRAYGEAYDLPVIVLRYFSVYGPRQRPDMGYHKFARALLLGEPLTVFGDGQQIRGNTYVDDCVAATIAVGLEPRVPAGEVFNVGGGEAATVWDILRTMEKLTWPQGHRPSRAGTARRSTIYHGGHGQASPALRVATARRSRRRAGPANGLATPRTSAERWLEGGPSCGCRLRLCIPQALPWLLTDRYPRYACDYRLVPAHAEDNHPRSRWRTLPEALPRLAAYLLRGGPMVPLSRHPAWLTVLERGLQHSPFCLEAVEGDRTRGFLALADVKSFLFGRFLVSLPYLNYGGPVTDDPATDRLLIDRSVDLANSLGVRYLELRHEHPVKHGALQHRRTDKVHMRLSLPATPGTLWDELDAKVRNQVRKGQKNGLTVCWGGMDQLDDFYAVFSQNMRDLGTPVYSRTLFNAILDQFAGPSRNLHGSRG